MIPLASLGAFLASFVEFAEALTVVLAVGSVRGWRPALSGAAAGLLLLGLLLAFAGHWLASLHLGWLKLPVGVLLLAVGIRWLRKSILRAAGRIPMRDERAAYGRARARASHAQAPRGPWDHAGFALALNVVLLEGVEVVLIVLAAGAQGGGLAPAAAAACLALALVAGLGAVMHGRIQRIPDNLLKGIVGVLMTALGIIWTGEGLGVAWPGGAASLVVAAAVLATLAVLIARLVGNPRGPAR